jgi:heat shock protein HtpX
MKRIFLFIAVNLLVMLVISFIVSLLGLKPWLGSRGIDYQSLLIMCALFGFGGAFISLQISRWTAKRALEIKLIDVQNPNGDVESQIVSKVRDLCRRSGLEALPEIGIYQSPEINAFATGPSRKRALLAISSSLLEHMDSGAVDGVIGHEITHIVNGDMVTMTLLQGLVNTFVMFVAQIAAFAIENAMRKNDDERGGLGFIAQFLLISVLESGLFLLASPVIYWFSRLREYRADSGSAHLTSPQTMIHALESLQTAMSMEDNRAPALSTFKINGRGRGLVAALFASHPPLEARIAVLKRLS